MTNIYMVYDVSLVKDNDAMATRLQQCLYNETTTCLTLRDKNCSVTTIRGIKMCLYG